MNEFHKKLLGTIKHENKEFEQKSIELFTEFFNELELIEERFLKEHHNNRVFGLDGGTAKEERECSKKWFQKYDELKKLFRIEK